MARAILVDDTDSNIKYTGLWSQVSGSYDDFGNFGQPFQHTLHTTNSESSFSYSFSGDSVLITGTNIYPSGATVPFECFVDNMSVPVVTLTNSENRLLFCEKDGLSEDAHIITVNVTASRQRTFLFDFIQYVPFAKTALDQVVLSIDYTDPQLQYGPGWSQTFPGILTRQPNSTFGFDFKGTSLTWLGFYDKKLPFAAATATYSIDGQPPIPFILNGIAAETTGVQYSQILFQTSSFSPGLHTIGVVYEGNSEATPLSLQTIIIQNGTVPPSLPEPIETFSLTSDGAAATSSSATVQSSQVDNPNPKAGTNSKNIGAIVGGVIGGLAVILFAAFAVLLLRERTKRRYLKAPSSHFVRPPSPPSAPIPPPAVRRSSIHKKIPPVSRYMPSLSTAHSLRSYNPPSTSWFASESGRSMPMRFGATLSMREITQSLPIHNQQKRARPPQIIPQANL
ncbi:hypothetical protein BDZ97DRAFT_1016956 [Flammula alnicola]|nr:hypothetical protein BDZ97DRAFT_1016956 [Flammula alnicola]